MLTRIQHSLSAKLIVLFICAGAVLLLLVGSILGKGFSRHFRSSIQPFMIHYIELMHQELGSPPDLAKARRITRDTPVDIHVFGPQQNWSTTGQLLDRAEIAEPFDSRRDRKIENLPEPHQRFRLQRINDEVLLHTTDGDHDIYFQINHPREFRHGGHFSLIILFSILGVLLLIYYATRALFKPIDDINHGVKQFGIGNLDHKITKHRNDQLGELTDSVNQMAEDIANMLEAKRQLLLGISHELRSPLTRSKVNLALLENSNAKTEIDNDIQSMDQLINELLESERLNSPHKVIQPEPTDVTQLVKELIDTEFKNENIVADLQSITADIDPTRIKLLVRNLLQNAIKYSSDATLPANISLQANSTKFTLVVEDFGHGIAREHIPFLTEPFYRADPSRQRLTGGYGLGLYLCRMIVEAHSGQIKVESQIKKGTRIECRIPVNG